MMRASGGASARAAEPPSVTRFADIMAGYDPARNRTSCVMTRFEKAKVLGMRTEQIARGAPPLIDLAQLPPADRTRADRVAAEELRQLKTPFVLGRNLPNGEREYWRIRDMIVMM